MVKFRSGDSYSGEAVPLCTFWRNDLRTDPTKEFSSLESTGEDYAQKDAGQNSSIGDFSGQCVANAYFPKSTITCFNDGDCNGEGKCITCSRYRAGGMKLAIRHSPPKEVLKFFGKGLTDEDIASPNLVRFPPSAAQTTALDQIPYHILLRNIQAEIAKCCHWNADTGAPGRFFLATIRNGSDRLNLEALKQANGLNNTTVRGFLDGNTNITLTNENGSLFEIEGISVKNPAFPDQVGTFFPVGTTVVAGWEDQPSFFLEPRTGLIRPGDGVIYSFSSGEGVSETSSSVRTKQVASDSNAVVTNAVNAAIQACRNAKALFDQNSAFFNNAFNSNDPATIAAAQAKLDEADANFIVGCDAAADAQDVGQECVDLIAATIGSSVEDLQANGQALADKLDELANLVEIAGGATTGSAATEAANQVRLLRINARTLRFSSTGGITRCEFFFTDENVAQMWNAPEDGSLPCNGVRTDCQFYTGKPWIHATDEKMELGRPILAEQIQEIRFRSENWARFVDPEEAFRNRFTTPFIWAFKDYVDVGGEPEIEDMILYRPKVLYGRGGAFSGFQQIRMDRVSVEDLTADEFAVSKSTSTTAPGSDTLDKDTAPAFPSLVSKPVVPSATRLSITHPLLSDIPFVYRMWSPDKNKITLFGSASPDQTIYIINNTALQNRQRYHDKFGTKNFFDLPTSLPKAPDFVGLTATEFLEITTLLSDEKSTNLGIEAPLGYDSVSSDRTGFWQSIQQVDLVHNELNEIFVFLVGGETDILVDRTLVDARFLHSIVAQTGFEGQDFTILNLGAAGSKLGNNVQDTASLGKITAEPKQIVGAGVEPLSFAYGYFAWRFVDRGLRFGTLNADNDLKGQNPIADQVSIFQISENAPSQFIVNVGYHVVEYEVLDQEISSDDWSIVNDCGFILVRIADPNVNRVLPLPNQEGDQKPLDNVLINGGGRGSIIAQWALTSATLEIGGEQKDLVQFYRDADGFGLPANYVILGPGPSAQNQFGRPDPTRDVLRISYRFIRGQSARQDAGGNANNPEDEPVGIEGATAINTNFYGDNLRIHRHSITFSDEGTLIAGGGGEDVANERISQDQQDYVFVFSDNEGRPLGRKNVRFYVMYYNLSCINVEIFYRWAADCTTYALIPDLFLRVGDAGGTMVSPPGATDDPNDDRLSLGNRIKNLLGDRDCTHQPNCGDHEFITFGPLRREFEVIVRIPQTDGSFLLKANFPSAGGSIQGEIVTSERPGSQFPRKHGPLWYPYTACERPRYQLGTGGPLNTDSTELINSTIQNPGIPQNGFLVVGPTGGAAGSAQNGVFGGLPDQSCEAYQGPNQVVAKILDIHPSLRPCTEANTYGNQILKSGENRFSGYARRRGAVDTFLYEGLNWTSPPFGNFGRPRLVFELSTERGDFLGGSQGREIGRRWMPLFPTLPNLGSSVGLFSEDLENSGYRMTCVSTPVGAIGETVPTSTTDGNLTILQAPRFSHKALIANKTTAAIEFPFSPYFPMFLPDGSVGLEPEEGRAPIEEGSLIGPISTMWAWREAEKNIQRAVTGGEILKGVSLASPEYFIDNRRLEIRLRPRESSYVLTWTPPTYNAEDGTILTNATLQLGLDGIPREIVLDFVNRIFAPADMPDTIYDVTKQLGEGVLECSQGASDNLQMLPQCSCITDTTSEDLKGPPIQLPSRFLHLDEVAPDGFVALYEDGVIQAPFLVDIPRIDNTQPCCMCVHYARGIFFSLNSNYIPVVSDINPAFDNRIDMLYTWSRVPHGLETGIAVDGAFNSFEQMSDELINVNQGEVFTNFIQGNTGPLDPLNDGGAIFPSQSFAIESAADENPILVGGALDPTDPVEAAKLKGGTPTDEGISRGETERIILSMVFNTYVKVKEVLITFYAGVGFEAPKYQLALVQPAQRVNDLITTNPSLIIGESLESAFERSIPGSDNLDSDDIQAGRAKFVSRLNSNYTNTPFWNQYGMEWQLIFPARGNSQSMGIASIQMTVDAIAEGSENTELIGVRERKYYRSIGSPTDANNPERFLGELDSATAYWRSTRKGSMKGDNRHRAYAWGEEVTDNQEPINNSDITFLETLQEQEYDAARSLLNSPYEFRFNSFLPLDENNWIEFLSEGQQTWQCVMTMKISPASAVVNQENQLQLYGTVPKRKNFNAPGHAWAHNFEESYQPCCINCPPSMVINYDFKHLHDNLALVETADFWSELPSGFTRLIRSTMMLPDPTFQGAEGGVGSTILLEEKAFTDSQGDPIPVEVLNRAGFSRDPATGRIYIDSSQPGAGVGGPAGPAPNCGGT